MNVRLAAVQDSQADQSSESNHLREHQAEKVLCSAQIFVAVRIVMCRQHSDTHPEHHNENAQHPARNAKRHVEPTISFQDEKALNEKQEDPGRHRYTVADDQRKNLRGHFAAIDAFALEVEITESDHG